jgi:hypothetical protein
MKANELRVGNWVNDENGVIPYQIRPQDFLPLSLPENEGKANPITLTPEILLKAGFDKMDLGIFESNKYDIYLYYSKEANGFLFKSRPDGGIILKHLHQLQNLYFALTGKELKIEL